MKNKIVFKILALLFFNLFAQLVFGQNILTGKSMVISTTGLNMRSEPNLNGKILAKIPFGEYVEVIDSNNYGKDTIGGHDYFYYDYKKKYHIPITGYWVKIKFNDKNGFVFSPYLYQVDHLKNINKLNKTYNNYGLLFDGVFCDNNFAQNPNLYWYGLYGNGENNYLKKIKISFFIDTNGELANLGISSDDNKNLIFMIGSHKELKQGKTKGKSTDKWWRFNIDKSQKILLDEVNHCNMVALQENDILQSLNPTIKGSTLCASCIIWEGDLDGDNKNDYIIKYGEKSAQTILYLSSEAEKNQIVKPVAIFYSGYCC